MAIIPRSSALALLAGSVCAGLQPARATPLG